MSDKEEIDAAFALFGPTSADVIDARNGAEAKLAGKSPGKPPAPAVDRADAVLAALDAVLARKADIVAQSEAVIAEMMASTSDSDSAPVLVKGIDAVERLQLARETAEENQPELWQEVRRGGGGRGKMSSVIGLRGGGGEKETYSSNFDVLSLPQMLPLAYGPVVLDSDMAHIGGKRGFRARHDLPPGTLLMSEKPFLSWPRMTGDLPLHEATLTSLLHQDVDVRAAVLSHLALLHPVKLADVPVGLVEQARREHGSWIQNIVDTLPEEDTVTFDDVLRILLVFQSNGFASGIYLHLSIFNHGCAANCIKYSPETENGPSEIRALRPIKAGEELIISYLDPVEMPTSARRQQLLGQFGFTCHCEWCERPVEMDEDAAKAELALHERMVAWKDKMNDGLAPGIVDELRAAVDEREWSDLMRARLYRLMLDAYGMVVALRNEATFSADVVHYLRAARELFLLQERIWGPTAAPLAETAVDLCNGIQALLGFDRQVLFDAFPDVWPDFSAATKFEYKANQVHNWLRAVYKRRSTGIELG